MVKHCLFHACQTQKRGNLSSFAIGKVTKTYLWVVTSPKTKGVLHGGEP